MNRMWLALVSFQLISCARPPESANDDSADRGENSTVTEGNTSGRPFGLMTFNTGLAPGVIPYAERRSRPIGQALSASDLDLICLQEVWRDEDWATIRRETESTFPYAVRPAHRSDVSPTQCRVEEIVRVERCSAQQCPAVTPEELPTCIARKCSGLAKTLSPGCIACLTRDPFRPAEEIIGECAAESDAPPQPSESTGLAYLGSYGLGLISKTTVSAQDLHPLESTMTARGIIHAEISPAGLGKLHVFCTHLTPQLRGVAHPAGGTWRAEQHEQIEALLAYIDEKSNGEPAVLLGDLNTGPSCSAAIHPRLEDHYQTLTAAGFNNAFLNAMEVPCAADACTLCYENPLAGNGQGGLLIDHILTRGLDAAVHASRAMDETLSFVGVPAPQAYSDHYAITAILEP